MTTEPDGRFQSAAEMLAALLPFVAKISTSGLVEPTQLLTPAGRDALMSREVTKVESRGMAKAG